MASSHSHSIARNAAYTSYLAAGWFLLATAAVGLGVLRHVPPPALPIAIATLTIAATAVFARRASAIPLRTLVTFHAWRIVAGAAFLVLYARGLLPFELAVVGGIGDILVGLLAPFAARARPAAIVAFSIAGFADLLFVLRAAYSATASDPSSTEIIRHLPLGLLPTFAVPVTLAAHLLAVARIRGSRRPEEPAHDA